MNDLTGDQPEPVPLDGPPADDPLVLALRRALAAEAAEIRPGAEGLSRIREALERDRWSAPRGRRSAPLLAALAAAGVVAAVVTGTSMSALTTPATDPAGRPVAAGVTDPWQASPVPPGPTPTTRTAVPGSASPSPEPTGSGGQTAAPTGAPALPVYYVGAQDTTFALFREFHPTTATAPAHRVQEAVTRALSSAPTDPDYDLVWPDGTTARTEVAAELISIDLSAEARAGGLGSQLAALAVQQLVYTATAAAADGSGTRPVRITVDGSAADLFGSVSLAAPLVRATGAEDPRAGVQISSLTEGTVVTAGPLVVTGEARRSTGSDGSRVGWELLREDLRVDAGAVPILAGSGGAPIPGGTGVWTLPVDVREPGRYRLAVRIPDAGGRQGAEDPTGGGVARDWVDDKEFVVR
jgi:spore germination protein GerM